MGTILNPVLRGFNPDPSFLRVEDDYYLATSTFEWFPGVQIHHSRDLIHWRLISRPLERTSQLNMAGDLNSGGVWAPCLSYDNGLFYLIYTEVKTKGQTRFRDVHNYLVTSPSITGEWSDPIFLNSSGFDPSLFHDRDGRKWLVNMLCDYRVRNNRFAGIVLQEYSIREQRLVGPITNIFKGTELGRTEGPHLYHWHGYYYLITAEGGTGFGHAVTCCRSREITGPYEVDPAGPILTSRYNPNLTLQRAGHGSIVETQQGEFYMAHLCGRPLPHRGRSVLGRETAIQKLVWTDRHWLRLANGGNQPEVAVPAPTLPEHPWPEEPARDDFDSPVLSRQFQTLRIPLGEDSLSLTERPGFLRLKGRESLASKYQQSLIARRQQAFCYTATTCVEFEPDAFQQLAGLVCLYDTQNFYYLRISHDELLGKTLGIIACQNEQITEPVDPELTIGGWERVYLQVRVDYDRLQFYYASDDQDWRRIGPVLDASILADECCMEGQHTGAFVGLCCQDLSGRRRAADFDFFEYRERELTK